MAPKKGGNSKKEEGQARKADTAQKKKDAVSAEKEKQEAAEWDAGAKSTKSKEDKEAKKAAEAAKKAEKARLLAEEEAALPSKPKATPKAGDKKKAPAGPGSLAAGGLKLPPERKKDRDEAPEMDAVVETFAATGIDDALDLLTTINAKKDKASAGAAAAQLEKHPERRFKAAFKEYEERMLPQLREERPGLRLQQYKDLVFKQFQKAPENPFNQAALEYNATKEERIEVLNKQRGRVEDRLRQNE